MKLLQTGNLTVLMNLGFKGKEIGNCLDCILQKVINGDIENNKETLLKYVKEKEN